MKDMSISFYLSYSLYCLVTIDRIRMYSLNYYYQYVSLSTTLTLRYIYKYTLFRLRSIMF